jgi:hypothetical protein
MLRMGIVLERASWWAFGTCQTASAVSIVSKLFAVVTERHTSGFREALAMKVWTIDKAASYRLEVIVAVSVRTCGWPVARTPLCGKPNGSETHPARAKSLQIEASTDSNRRFPPYAGGTRSPASPLKAR